MRLTAEQFNRRKENRVRGIYTIRPVNTRGWKKRGPECAQCGRPTEYLFPGVIHHEESAGKVVTKEGMVCQRCRPPSNLEILEMLEEGRYKGQTIEVRTLK